MNFYQRANLSMGLAVVLALELAISNQIQSVTGNADGPRIDYWSFADETIWIVFQFLFRMKVTIDDHAHFATRAGSGIAALLDFLLFVFASLMFILAAAFSFSLAVSGYLFIGGLVVATVWAALHLGSSKIVWRWVVLNVAYVAVILLFGAGVLPWAPWLPLAVLAVLLFVDFVVSETVEHMPAS